MPDRPCVFVSSTFYDLKYLRDDLRSFIEGLGFESLLSEFPSFPIDPDLQTVQACKKVVGEKADIFVLVVGGRYGSITTEGRSVTNIEYLEARAKGIPIYAFVDKTVLAVLPVWRQNRSAGFTKVVDTTKLFEFVESIYTSGERWVFPFESAADIKDALLCQWPNLIKEGLTLRRRIRGSALPSSLAALHGEALRIVIEKPDRWEAMLLVELIRQELASATDLRRDLHYDISDRSILVTLDRNDAFRWLNSQMKMAEHLIEELKRLAEKAIMDAFGTNEEDLVYAMKRWGAMYRRIVEHAIDCRRHVLPEGFEKVAEIQSRIWIQLINDLDTDFSKLSDELAQAARGATDTVKFTVELRSADLSGLDQAIKEALSTS